MTIEVIGGITICVLVLFFIIFCNSIKRRTLCLNEAVIKGLNRCNPSEFCVVIPNKFARLRGLHDRIPILDYFLSKPIPTSHYMIIKDMLKHERFLGSWIKIGGPNELRITLNPVWANEQETLEIADRLVHNVYKAVFEEPEDPCAECNGFCGECDDYINSPSKKAFEFNETDESEDDFETEEQC